MSNFRIAIALAIALLLALVVATIGVADEHGGPDSVYVPGRGYVNIVDNTVYPRGVLPVPQPQAGRFGTRSKPVNVKQQPSEPKPVTTNGIAMAGTGGQAIEEARRWLGQTGRTLQMKHRGLWCAEFMTRVADRVGMRKPAGNTNMVDTWLNAGVRTNVPQPGAIAITSNRRHTYGHIGIVTKVNADGSPVIISGNHNDRVVETTYPRSRVVAYVIPQ